MQLIKKTKKEKTKNGNSISYGLFLCPYCLQEVERQINNGKRQKSCGCQQYSEDIINKKLKNRKVYVGQNNPFYGKHHTEETKKKQSETKKGCNNYFYGKHHTEEAKKKQSESHKGKQNFLGKKHTEEWKLKQSERKKGKNNAMYGKSGILSPNWQGGISFEPYSPEFNKDLKQSILDRDNNICQDPNCNIENPKILCIHHIDYDKNNNDIDNLITLCCLCHLKTNGKSNRFYYEKYYKNIIGGLA